MITVKRHGGDFMQKQKLCISILLVMILSFSLLVPSFAEDSVYVWSTNSKEIDENENFWSNKIKLLNYEVL